MIHHFLVKFYNLDFFIILLKSSDQLKPNKKASLRGFLLYSLFNTWIAFFQEKANR